MLLTVSLLTTGSAEIVVGAGRSVAPTDTGAACAFALIALVVIATVMHVISSVEHV